MLYTHIYFSLKSEFGLSNVRSVELKHADNRITDFIIKNGSNDILMEYKYWSSQDLALVKKDFENEIAKDIAAGRNWQIRVYRSSSGWSSDAVLQNKIIEMMENGQLEKVYEAVILKTGGDNISTPLLRANYLRPRIKTI